MVRKARFLGGALLVAGLVTVVAGSVWTGPARAADPTPVCSAGSCTVTYAATGTWIVPAGVTSAKFDVKGAGGSAGGCATAPSHHGGAGGSGDEVTATETVAPSQSYTLTVGTAGTAGECSGANGTGGTQARVNGGNGGEGDTADAATRAAAAAAAVRPPVSTILIAAGGGGGGGGGGASNGTPAVNGTLGSSTGGGPASASSGGGGGGGGGNATGAGGAVGTTGDGGAGGNSGSDSVSGTSTTTNVGGGGAAGSNGSVTVTYSGLVPSTTSATMVTATTVTLNGSDPNWTFTGETYYFEYSTHSTFAASVKTTAATPASSSSQRGAHRPRPGDEVLLPHRLGGGRPGSREFPPDLHNAQLSSDRPCDERDDQLGDRSRAPIRTTQSAVATRTTSSTGRQRASARRRPRRRQRRERCHTTLTNLKPSTNYHYKIVSTAAGPDPSNPHNFKTFSYSADIHLTGPSHGKLGKKLTYKVIFTNSGTGAIPLPLADVTLKSAKHQKLKISAPGCSQHGKTLDCRFGKSAAVGSPLTHTFVIKVTGKPGTLTMSGVVVSIGTLTDPSAHSTAKLSTKLTR